MTYGELKQAEMYINVEDVDVCVNGGEPINEEFFYVDEFCQLDSLPVVGTAHCPNGNLTVDLICTNWNQRFKEDWIPEPIL